VYKILCVNRGLTDCESLRLNYAIKNNRYLNKGDLMKTTRIISSLNLNFLVLSLLLTVAQQAGAECVSGSISVKASLYIVTVDASRMITYQQLIGNVAKKAALTKDCVGSTTYTITDTKNLPYPDGTRLVVVGKNAFNTPTPTALAMTVTNGSINGTVTASGAQTGINTDSFSIYIDSTMVMRVKQPWK
jgi:hypothetical protein